MTRFEQTSTDGQSVSGLPVAGPITSVFGARDIPDHAQGHSGWDIGAAQGTEIHAPAAGTVRFVSVDDGSGWAQVFGNSVILDHGDAVTLYGHMVQAPSVTVGQQVTAGDLLGYVGSTGQSTGPHLHWGMAPASNPWLQREGPGGLWSALDYCGPEQPAPIQAPQPSDHAPAANDPKDLAAQLFLAAQQLNTIVQGGAPLAAVQQVAATVRDDAAAIAGGA